MNIHVDTLEYARMLEDAGMQRAHAEAVAKLQARTVKDLVDHELVTQDHLDASLGALEIKLRDEIRAESAKLRDEIRSESAELRDEIRSESAKLREEIRGESSKLRDEAREEAASTRQRLDAMMLQFRSLQIGGAIAAFAISGVVLLSRLIR